MIFIKIKKLDTYIFLDLLSEKTKNFSQKELKNILCRDFSFDSLRLNKFMSDLHRNPVGLILKNDSSYEKAMPNKNVNINKLFLNTDTVAGFDVSNGMITSSFERSPDGTIILGGY